MSAARRRAARDGCDPPNARPGPTARRNRTCTIACVAAYLLVMRQLVPDHAVRADRHYLVVITLGYGHLIGAAVFGRHPLQRVLRPCGSPALAAASLLCAIASLYIAYAWALQRWPLLLAPLLGLATWHTVENDRMLGRAYLQGLALPTLERGARAQLTAIGSSALIVCLAAALLLPARDVTTGALGFGDLFAATTLYHLVSWLLLLFDRALLARSSAATLWPLAAVHLAPALLCIGAVLSSAEAARELRALLFSPSFYLFWSLLHVVQTALTREIGARSTAPAGHGREDTGGRQPGSAATSGTIGQ